VYKELRKLILELSYNAGVGHIGPHLSIVDLVWCLYDSVLNFDCEDPANNGRDRFVLSKGHAALALYVVLYYKKFISKEELYSYCNKDGSLLGVHPKHYINGVDFSTGSLGQGVNYAVGCAVAAKIQKSDRKIYCLISDGEINEGCVWEGFMFAYHHKLNNLVFILDNNGQQALGKTKDIIDHGDLRKKILSFGMEYYEVNGHDHAEIKKLYTEVNRINGDIGGSVFIDAKTISGKGVDYMEGTIKWHYKSLDENQYCTALEELEKSKR